MSLAVLVVLSIILLLCTAGVLSSLPHGKDPPTQSLDEFRQRYLLPLISSDTRNCTLNACESLGIVSQLLMLINSMPNGTQAPARDQQPSKPKMDVYGNGDANSDEVNAMTHLANFDLVKRVRQIGYAGLVMSNGAPMMVPPRSKVSSIGANCLAFGARGRDSYFMLDMAASMKDIGSIEWALTKDEYIPHSWAADESGYSTSFPMLAMRNPRLASAGAHKGYCLAAMIDLLCGVLSGANFSTQIPPWKSNVQSKSPNLGQIFFAIDPDFFVPDFLVRLDDFNECIKNSCPVKAENPIQLPGELEMRHMHLVEKLGGLPYHKGLLKKYRSIASRYSVRPIQLFSKDD